MENHNQVIDTWIFEYFAHKCVKEYFENGCNGNSVQWSQVDVFICALTAYLNERKDGMTQREYICILFLHLLSLEESFTQDDSQTDCDLVSSNGFRKSMPQQIAFASRDSKSDATKCLARKCLVQTHVVVFKHCLRNNTDWNKALDDFQEFVKLMPFAESEEMYKECTKMKEVQPDDDFLSDYLDLIRHLVLTLYSELDDPYLIKLASSLDSICDRGEMDIEDELEMNSFSPNESSIISSNDSERKEGAQQKSNQHSNRTMSPGKFYTKSPMVVSENERNSSMISETDSDNIEVARAISKSSGNLMITSDSDSDNRVGVVPKSKRNSMITSDSDSEKEVGFISKTKKKYVVAPDSCSENETGVVGKTKRNSYSESASDEEDGVVSKRKRNHMITSGSDSEKEVEVVSKTKRNSTMRSGVDSENLIRAVAKSKRNSVISSDSCSDDEDGVISKKKRNHMTASGLDSDIEVGVANKNSAETGSDSEVGDIDKNCKIATVMDSDKVDVTVVISRTKNNTSELDSDNDSRVVSKGKDDSLITSETDSAKGGLASVSNTSEPDKNLDKDGANRFSSELKVLLRDGRPSKMSDIKEIQMEESDTLTRIRKRAEKFNAHDHLRNVVQLTRRIRRKPPSHQGIRGGIWMPEEEKVFIKKTLEIGIGRWKEIKTALQTFRSAQQLKDKWRQIKPVHIDEIRKEFEIT